MTNIELKWADAKKGDRVVNKQTGWTGVLTRDPRLLGRGNNTARIRWDQNGHEGTISLNNTQIVATRPQANDRCPRCKGTGGGTYNDCPACDGNGVI